LQYKDNIVSRLVIAIAGTLDEMKLIADEVTIAISKVEITVLMISIEPKALLETSMFLIPEKTTLPKLRPGIVRPRLLVMLQNSLDSCASTVVSGRAGTGKTALVVTFARICGRPIAWYKVDASDIEFRVFLRYLVASIARQRPGFGEETLAALNDFSADDSLAPADTFLYELLEYQGKALLVVLEDLHLISEADWLMPFLCRLLPLLPRNLHILITSRTMPPAPLWRMRSKQTLKVIDEEMLAFTQAEAFELFQTYGLSSRLARAACARSRGRAASLAAYAVALAGMERAGGHHPGDLDVSDFA
jgi:ATP/maltotriose-dependent transcriptional regulator MalT